MKMYVGGYGKRSLSLCEFDPDLPRAEVLESYEIENASYILMSGNKKNLYSVIEKNLYKNHNGGGLVNFKVKGDGRLELVREMFTEGADPCYLSLDEAENMLYIANYSDGSLSFFTLNSDGSVDGFIKKIDNSSFGAASGAVPERQEKPHAHFIAPFLGELWICDLGMDKVFIYGNHSIEPREIKLKPGSGPRHLAFNPHRPISYLACELSGEIAVIDENKTILAYVKTLELLHNNNTLAAIRVSPGGEYVLVSNRGADCISVLKLNTETGIPELSGEYSSGGLCPRDFAFDTSGRFIACANQESDNVSFFEWDEKKGRLSEKIADLKVIKPTCVLFS